jgi:PAS domain S-box-containing protein/diguanylate cyclase (GGDEF)-like protein
LYDLFREILAVPASPGDEHERQARILRVILLVTIASLIGYGLFIPFFQEQREARALYVFSALVVNAVAYLLFRQGRTRLSGILSIAVFCAILTVAVLSRSSLEVAFTGFLLVVTITSLLFHPAWALLLAAGVSALGFHVFILQPRISSSALFIHSVNDWIAYSIYLFATALLTGFTVLSLERTWKRVRREWQDRLETESHLASSRSQLELALSAADVVAWEWDLASGLITWSENTRTTPGLETPPGTYERFMECILPDDREGVERAIADCLDGLTVFFRCEFRLRHADGAMGWVETRGRALRPAGERAERVMGVLVDIQERKKSEQTRIHRENEMRSLIGDLDIGVILMDLRGTAHIWNRKSLNLFGLREDQAGKPGAFLELPLSWEDGTPIDPGRHPVRLVIESGEPICDRLVRFSARAQGEPAWLLLNVLPQRDSDGALSGVLLSATDLTSSRRMQTALRETEERWFGLLSDIPDHVISLDKEGRILFINRGIAGEERGGLTGRLLGDFLPPQSAEVVKGLLGHVFQSALAAEVECRGPGESQWSCRMNPVRRGDQVVAVFLFAQDVTRRRDVEQALSESEGRFQTAFDFSPVGMALLSTDGRLLRANHRLSEILDYPEGELEGRHFIDITLPEDRATGLENIRRLLQGELMFIRSEKRFLRRDGRPLWGQLMIGMVRDEGGAPSVLVCQIQDITERRETETALAESEKRFRAIVEASPLGLLFLRLEEDGRLLFTGFNPAALRLFDLDLAARIGMTLEQAFPGLKGTELPERFRQAARTGEYWSTRQLEYQEEPVRGIFEFHAFRIAPGHVAAMFQDITARKQVENEVLLEKRFTESVVNTIPGIFVVCDQAGYLTQWNETLSRELGYDPGDLARAQASTFVHPEDQDSFLKMLFGAFDGGGGTSECRVLTQGGETRHYFFSTSILELDGRRLVACIGVDIAERLRIENALARSEDRFRALSESSFEAILIHDHGQILDCNRMFTQLSGWSLAEIVERDGLDFLLHPEDRERADLAMSRDEIDSYEMRFRLKDGSWALTEVRSLPIHWEGRMVRAVVLRDITQERILRAKLEHLAYFDGPTGLPNRRHLLQHLETRLAASTPGGPLTALIAFHLRHFHRINDRLGHATGDGVLASIGPRLQPELDGRDGELFHLGGEEFGVLYTAIPDEAHLFAEVERIRRSLSVPFPIGGVRLGLIASFGMALSPIHGSDAPALLRAAETAMQVSTRQHLPEVFYRAEFARLAPRQIELLAQLEAAIAAHEFVIHYQPKIQPGRPGNPDFEALVRWAHPRIGLIPPSEFIPLAEIGNLIKPLTLEILEQALSQWSRWKSNGVEARISVNLSAESLTDADFPGSLCALLAAHQVTRGCLELEISERSVMDEIDNTRTLAERLQGLGVALTVDHYGTGNSALAYLGRVPLRALKIDLSFVQSLKDRPQGAKVLASIIEMAHHLDLEVVAEGVEDEATLRLLEGLRVDQVQGFHLGKPLPAVEIDLSRWGVKSGG